MGLTVDASAIAPDDHMVLFYEHDRFLCQSVAGYARQGLAEGRDVLIVASSPHRRAIEALLDSPARPGDSDARLTMLDASGILDELYVDGAVDAGRLHDRFVPWLAAANRSGRTPRIYGEMVALLCDDGRLDQALHLEALWNRMGESFSFSLLCGYPMRGFSDRDSTTSFLEVCQQHAAVSTESYAQLRDDPDDPVPMVVLNGDSPGGRIDRN